jgi:hypothetical protein
MFLLWTGGWRLQLRHGVLALQLAQARQLLLLLLPWL